MNRVLRRGRSIATPPLAVLCFSGVGCTVARDEIPARLPFRVALMPARLACDAKGDAETLRVDYEARGIWSEVALALERDCFVDVVLLDVPDRASAAEFAALPIERQDAHWVQAAIASRADLLLETELHVPAGVEPRINEKFWLNLPLFLLGGPACYFVDDRSYLGEARLDASLHHVEPLADGQATLADGRARAVQVTTRLDRVHLDFLDRAGSSLLLYAMSLVLPPGLLAVRTDASRRKVARALTQELAEGIDRELHLSARELTDRSRVMDLWLEPEYSLASSSPGVFRLQADVVLRRGRADRLDRYTIRCGEHRVTQEFEDGIVDTLRSTSRERFLRYHIDAEIQRADPSEAIHLETVAGGRDARRRSFTLAVGGTD